MTYLEIVNEVLRRLREREVSSINQTTYSKMVGDFVNDAKRDIETSWDWGANRDIISVYTIVEEPTYTLTGFGQFGRILSSWNDTSNRNMYERSQQWLDARRYGADDVPGSPYLYAFRGQDANQDAILEVYPTPDAAYTLKLNCYLPQPELVNPSDVLNIPWRPVALLAAAMLAEEKGEAGGSTSARYFEMANKAISDAIAIDANRYPAELMFVGV
jgi:hypothetical protein